MSDAVAQLGPLGIFLMMIPESACLPLPSELTLLSAGFGVHQGWFSFPVAVAAATAGNLTGSLIAYWLGHRGVLAKLPGRAGVAVARCEQLFGRCSSSTVFIARLLPLAEAPSENGDAPGNGGGTKAAKAAAVAAAVAAGAGADTEE